MCWIIYLGVIFILVLIFTYQIFLLLEEKILFVPIREHIWSPPESSYRELFFSQLHAWYFQQASRPPVVLFCHGNTGNISHRKYVIDLCHAINLSLFIFDYRGYGKSQGRATIDSICHDGEVAYNYLREMGYQPNEIIIWGESLGGLIATHVAAKYPCSRLLLMATFADLSSLARDNSSLIGKMVYPFLLLQGDSNIDKIKHVSAPILIIHSEEDEIIPYQHGQRLYQAITHSWKAFLTIKGCHASPQLTSDVIEDVMRFCWQEPRITPACLDILTYVARSNVKHGK